MVMDYEVSEHIFEATLKGSLGENYQRALKIWQKIGKNRGLELVFIFLHAVEKKCDEKIINDLELVANKDFFTKPTLEEINKAIKKAEREVKS